MKTTVKLLGLLGLLTLLNYSELAYSETVVIRGGAAPTNNIFKKMKADFEAKNPGIILDIAEMSPEEALDQLGSGKSVPKIDIAAAGLNFDDWVKLCEEKNKKVNANDFRRQVIGRDLVSIYVHKDTKLEDIKMDHLKSIFTGQATDWKAFGGTGAITIVFGEKITGTNKTFKKVVNEGAEFGGKIIKVGSTEEIIAKISETSGAIGFGPMGAKIESFSVKLVHSPEIGRPITAAFKGEPSETLIKVLNFAKNVK